MKCADCKYWVADRDALSSFEGSEGIGDCRRRAPMPVAETAAVILEVLRDRGRLGSADDAPPDYELMAPPTARLAVWPTTWGSSFCGDFYVKREPVF